MAKSSAKVVIVGAGVAGMTAAAWLINNKVEDIIILEAQDYVGGRVKAEVVDGRNIDLGAQFVHGRKGNPAFEIAEKLGLVLFPEQEGTMIQNWPREFLTTAGEKIPAKTVEDLLQFLQDELNARFDDIQRDDRGSDGEYFERAYRKYLDLHQKDLTPHEKILYDAIFRWHCSYNKIDNAVTDLKQLSAWGASEYKVLPGDRFTDTEGGMTAILDAVSKLVPKDVIRLRTPVKKIDWSATSQSTAADDKVLVTCENDDVIEADHVIVTISLGCLQARHEKMFHPNLPLPFQTAMSHFGYGSIGKIFLTWNERFWNLRGEDYFDSFEFLWLDSHHLTILSDKCQQKTKLGKAWWDGIYSLETVYGHPNMLEMWLTEDQVEVVEGLEDEEVKAVCWELIQKMFKGVCVPEPNSIYRTKWLTNPYTLGTYSYPACSLRRSDLEHFGKPLPSQENPRVLFAGEAYRMDFISTFHGALLSGQSQADLLLKAQGIHPSIRLLDLIQAP